MIHVKNYLLSTPSTSYFRERLSHRFQITHEQLKKLIIEHDFVEVHYGSEITYKYPYLLNKCSNYSNSSYYGCEKLNILLVVEPHRWDPSIDVLVNVLYLNDPEYVSKLAA